MHSTRVVSTSHGDGVWSHSGVVGSIVGDLEVGQSVGGESLCGWPHGRVMWSRSLLAAFRGVGYLWPALNGLVSSRLDVGISPMSKGRVKSVQNFTN